jgi:acyl carrier protein
MLATQDVVINQIADILADRRTRRPIEPRSLLRDELGLTSLNMIELLTNVCRDLGVDVTQLSDVDLARMKSVEDVIAVVQPKG